MNRITNIVWKTIGGISLGGFEYEYDAVGRIVSRSHAIGSNAFDRVYAYVDFDRLASDDDVTYTYDAAGRRIIASKTGTAFTQDDSVAYNYNIRSEFTNAVASVDSDYRYAYEFDDIGNRESSSERGTNSVYTANSLNQYTAVDDFTPQFDDDGNQTLIKTGSGVWQVTYNGENRPVMWVSGTTNIVMSFDCIGRRVAKMICASYMTDINRLQELIILDLMTSRWLCRDPINEIGNMAIKTYKQIKKIAEYPDTQLYIMVNNDPIDNLDDNGLIGHIAGGALVGCTAGATYSLITSWLGGDSACQCSCKAFGSCAVGAVFGAMGAAQPAWAGCLAGMSSNIINLGVSSVCDKACGKPQEQKGICVILNIMISGSVSCMAGPLASAPAGKMQAFAAKFISNVIGFDVLSYCGLSN